MRFPTLLFFLILSFNNGFSQSWRYYDNLATIGWISTEFNNHIIVSSTKLDSLSGKHEPLLLQISGEGKLVKTISLPLFKHNLERGILTLLLNHSSDSLVAGGLAYSTIDSSAYLVILILNQKLELISTTINKLEIPDNIIPSRNYSPKVDLHFDAKQFNFYGSISICSAKKDGISGETFVNAYQLPCYHLFFKLDYSGKIKLIKKTPVNVSNKENFILPKTNLTLLKSAKSGFISNSFTEGTLWLNDSFNIIKTESSLPKKYKSSSYSNDFIELSGYYYSLGLINYDESIRKGNTTFEATHNRICIQKFSLDGTLIKEKFLFPIMATDSSSWLEFKNGNYVSSYQVSLFNAIIKSAISTKDGKLVFTYRNQNGGLFVIKLDSDLNLIWTKTIQMPFFNYYSVAQAEDSAYVLTGWSVTSGSTELPLFAIKLGMDGVLNSTIDKQIEKNSFQIYPNPFENNISISFENKLSQYIDLKIYDMNGKVVFADKVADETIIETSNLKPGIYFCLANNADNFYSKAFKIIKL